MLGIPSVYDRVCQQALLNRLEPIFEPVFDEASFGYRRGRSTHDALRKVWKEIKDGREWIVDADLKDFFGSVDHDKLLAFYCTRNQKGNFKVGLRTEKSRLQRSLTRMQDLMRRMRHLPVKEQVVNLNRVLRGHYAYYGVAGNFRALQRVYRAVERNWQRMLGSRSRAGQITWEVFHRIKQRYPLLRPKLFLPYRELQAIAVL